MSYVGGVNSPVLTEKKIYDSWSRHFGYPQNVLEQNARKTPGQVRNLKSTSIQTVRRQLQSGQLTFIGDDSLNENQTALLISLLQSLKSGTKIFVTTRFDRKCQKYVDRFMNGKVSIHHLLTKLKLEPLQYDGFKSLLVFLRRHRFKIAAVGMRNFKKENLEIKKVILAGITNGNPMVVWTGHFRLPFLQKQLRSLKPLAIHLQCNDLRWKYERRRGWVTWNSQSFAFLNFSPLLSLDLFRATGDQDQKMTSPEKINHHVFSIMHSFSKILKQDKYSRPRQIIHVFDVTSMAKLRSLKNNRRIFEFVTHCIKRGESAVIPSRKMILISTQKLSHIAEEVAHYIRLVDEKAENFGEIRTIIEEAFAFFASLLLFPDRPIPERKKIMTSWDHAHYYGYHLGLHLFKKWRIRKHRTTIEKLWNFHPKNETEARSVLNALRNL